MICEVPPSFKSSIITFPSHPGVAMPGNPIFTRLFGRSPISSLQGHMKIASQCASLLPGFFAAVKADDWTEAARIRADIVDLEGEADDLKRELRLGLPRSLFLQVPRSDLLELLQMQDRIPNRTKDISGMVIGRKMQIPLNLLGPFEEFLKHCVATAAMALTALSELDELASSGFSGHDVESLEKLLIGLSDAEHESDVSQVSVEQALFAIEKELDPVEVMFLYRIISWVGDLADDAQAVGNRMLYVIAR